MIKKILIVQTAFPGDVILSTALLESLRHSKPEIRIDILVRKGNETLFNQHPYLNKVLVWDKKKNKTINLLKLISEIRKEKYDLVINLQRFAGSGLLTLLSGAAETRGFDKNPFSFAFTKKYQHKIGDGRHEIERNHDLISDMTQGSGSLPKLYPTQNDFESVKPYKQSSYICIAPGSVWFTKTFPAIKWIEFIQDFCSKKKELVYLIGSADENKLCEEILIRSKRVNVYNLAGMHSLLQSAALMKDAEMNYVNDSAPMHLASSMNAPTTVIYCSTIPAFGFGPLSEKSRVIETTEKLHCRPCGIHGHNKCPLGHFNCAFTIDTSRLTH